LDGVGEAVGVNDFGIEVVCDPIRHLGMAFVLGVAIPARISA